MKLSKKELVVNEVLPYHEQESLLILNFVSLEVLCVPVSPGEFIKHRTLSSSAALVQRI